MQIQLGFIDIIQLLEGGGRNGVAACKKPIVVSFEAQNMPWISTI
jgi:hypothetical protein